ncbi:MAG TPA: hypothetical protein VIX42_11785, partial [Edaphobacter sp.]
MTTQEVVILTTQEIVISTTQEIVISTGANGQSHCPLRSGETPAFRLCRCTCPCCCSFLFAILQP